MKLTLHYTIKKLRQHHDPCVCTVVDIKKKTDGVYLWLAVLHIAKISTASQSMMLQISHTKSVRPKINHFDSNEN
jgi:hypothetical protein